MNNGQVPTSLKPGQINIQRRRRSVRQQFDPKSINIQSIDEALAFVDMVAEKMGDVRKVLAKAKMQGVYQNNRQSAQDRVMNNPIMNPESGNTVEVPKVEQGSVPQAKTEEQRRLEQLRNAQEALQDRKPVEMPGIPGISAGKRENPKPNVNVDTTFKRPEEIEENMLVQTDGETTAETPVEEPEETPQEEPESFEPPILPLTPDEESEMSSTLTAEERKKLETKQKRSAALKKARAAAAAKRAKIKAEKSEK